MLNICRTTGATVLQEPGDPACDPAVFAITPGWEFTSAIRSSRDFSIGVGVNWISPFGPLRIDLAKALLKQKGDDTKLFLQRRNPTGEETIDPSRNRGVAAGAGRRVGQSIPAAIVAVVDLEKVTSQCNACKTATATLQGQLNGLKSREPGTGDASAGGAEGDPGSDRQADPGSGAGRRAQARIKAFQTKQQQGAQELQRQQQAIQRNQAYISQQISASLARSTSRSCSAAAPT